MSEKGLALIFSVLFIFVSFHQLILPLSGTRPRMDHFNFIWGLWEAERKITSGDNPYRTEMLFAPDGTDNLAHHTYVVGYFPVTWITKHLSDHDPLYPFYAFRFSFWLGLTFLAFFSYLLLRELDMAWWVTVIPLIGFVRNDFFVLHRDHLNHAAAFFFPLVAWRILRLYKEPNRKNLIYVAIPLAISIYFTEFIVHIHLAILFWLFFLLVLPSSRRDLLKRIRQLSISSMLITLLVWALLLTPFLLNYIRADSIKPDAYAHYYYSADLLSFFIPDGHATPLYRGWLDGWADKSYEAFLGWPMLMLGVIGLVTHRRHAHLLTAGAMILLFLTLSLGPQLVVANYDVQLPLPYRFFMSYPPLNLNRTPIRFVVVAQFFLLIITAVTIAHLHRKLPSSLFWCLWGVLLLWTWAETQHPLGKETPFTLHERLPTIEEGYVLNVPPRINDGFAAALQTIHHRPLVLGYLARNTSAQLHRFEQVTQNYLSADCPSLTNSGITHIIVNPPPFFQQPDVLDVGRLYSCDIPITNLAFNPVAYPFTSAIQLDAQYIDQTSDTISVNLLWKMMGESAEDYTISAQLLNADGERVASLDQQPEYGFKTYTSDERIITTHELSLPTHLSDGTYTIALFLYYFMDDEYTTIQTLDTQYTIQLDQQQ